MSLRRALSAMCSVRSLSHDGSDPSRNLGFRVSREYGYFI